MTFGGMARLLQVSNLSPSKRCEDSIQALGLLCRKGYDATLTVDGAGSHTYLDDVLAECNVRNKVFFSHVSTDAALRWLYLDSDIFVFPCPITWGLVVAEAMMLGKPVVVTDGCGIAEVIRDGETGLIFKNTDWRDMALKIEALILDERLRRQIGVAAQEYVRKNLSWENYTIGMERYFRTVVRLHC